MRDRYAPEGKLWVCVACGKTETDRHGQTGGWDESCMLNSVLLSESEIVRGRNGRVVEIIAQPHEAT